jgi:hypothetical protein
MADTKVSRDTFVQLFAFDASGVIALLAPTPDSGIRSKGEGT